MVFYNLNNSIPRYRINGEAVVIRPGGGKRTEGCEKTEFSAGVIKTLEKHVDEQHGEKVSGGTLYVVATPIGNLRDITLRALDILRGVDVIAAEDTRHSAMLLRHYQIQKRLISFHDHNKNRQTPVLIRFLQQGDSVALISDAGTPGISDPGFFLIREAIAQDIPIIQVPGATALIPALVLSGLPLHRFVFEGFPPVKKGRAAFFKRLTEEERTLVFYESPHRLTRTITDLYTTLGPRRAAIVRELTKKFEEVIRADLHSLVELLQERKLKGECVIVVEGKSEKQVKENS